MMMSLLLNKVVAMSKKEKLRLLETMRKVA